MAVCTSFSDDFPLLASTGLAESTAEDADHFDALFFKAALAVELHIATGAIQDDFVTAVGVSYADGLINQPAETPEDGNDAD